MQILNGQVLRSDTNIAARGGTELMCERLVQSLDPELLSNFQIVVSRLKDTLDDTKIRIYYCHDLPSDPESAHLANEGWKKFHRLVFVSNWQMQAYINAYNIPWSKCVVLQNAITPIEDHVKPTDKISLAYWSTPHRGLNILVPVFEKLCEKYDNIELNVYSSFNLYGWPEADKDFESLFDKCRQHPKIVYHGSLPNEQLREELKKNHILAYPSQWVETSCLVLQEAMSAGMLCVHSNLGALPETAANWTAMYQFDENPSHHASYFYMCLDGAISNLDDPTVQSRIASQQGYANVFYNWEIRKNQWRVFLESLLSEPRAAEVKMFNYKIPG